MDNQICDLFIYKDGVLHWKNPRNGARKGRPAGTIKDGYIRVSVNRKLLYAHRIIFLMHHGYLPEYIDHVNRDRSDNRIENLRECSSNQNARNTAVRANATGFKGVNFASKNRFRAYITINKKQKFLGIYQTVEQAKKARVEAANKYFQEYANEWI